MFAFLGLFMLLIYFRSIVSFSVLLLNTRIPRKAWVDRPRGPQTQLKSLLTSSQRSFLTQGTLFTLSGWDFPTGASKPYTHLPTSRYLLCPPQGEWHPIFMTCLIRTGPLTGMASCSAVGQPVCRGLAEPRLLPEQTESCLSFGVGVGMR